MKIAIRLDDITPDMDWKKFLEFKGLLDEYDLKPLIGVVPDNKDAMLKIEPARTDFWAYIKGLEKENWIIAMHGYEHVYDQQTGGMFPLNDFSEFAGASLELQKARILRGKEIFNKQGIHTDIFMAPAHAYDENTLIALKENGFRRITDGFGKYPYLFKDMIFYPISFRVADSLKQPEGYTTLVVHTNTIENMDYYRCMLKEHRKDFISFHEYIKILPKPVTGVHRRKEYLLAKTKHFLVSLRSKSRQAKLP